MQLMHIDVIEMDWMGIHDKRRTNFWAEARISPLASGSSRTKTWRSIPWAADSHSPNVRLRQSTSAAQLMGTTHVARPMNVGRRWLRRVQAPAAISGMAA